jgi:hypothetical protein
MENFILFITGTVIYHAFSIICLIATPIAWLIRRIKKPNGKISKLNPTTSKVFKVIIFLLWVVTVLNIIIFIAAFNIMRDKTSELEYLIEENRKIFEKTLDENKQSSENTLNQLSLKLSQVQLDNERIQSLNIDLISLNDELMSIISPSDRLRFMRNPEDLNNLHPLLHVFTRPFVIFETNEHTVRIDVMANQRYRYAQWEKEVSMTELPDLILYGLTTEGLENHITLTFWEGTAVLYEYTVVLSINGGENTLIRKTHGLQEIYGIINIIYRDY